MNYNMFGLETFKTVVGTMSESAKALNQFKDSVITATECVNEHIVGPLYESVKNINTAIDTYEEAKDFVSVTVNDFSGDISVESLQKGFENFNKRWDKFADNVSLLYEKLPESIQESISENFKTSLFNENILNAGSTIKNELPGLFKDISSLKDISSSFKDFSGIPIKDAAKLKNGIDTILKATKNISKSIDDMTGNSFSTIINRLTADSKILATTNNCITGLTDIVNNNLYKPLSDITNIANNALNVYDASKTTLAALSTGHLSLDSLANATANLNKSYDAFAKSVNDSFNRLSSGEQKNVLEAIAKTYFGENVFNASSVIKNNVPNILSGVADFKKSIDLFDGSYRNPEIAINKIRNGVQSIVDATDKIADSLNNIYKNFRKDDNKGLPLLNNLSSLQDYKLIQSVNTTLQACTDVTEVVKSVKNVRNAIKSGNRESIQNCLKSLNDTLGKLSNYKSDSESKDKSSLENISQDKSKQENSSNKRETGNNDKRNNYSSQENNNKKAKENGQSDSYVTSQATLRCPFGDKTSKLTVYPDRTVYLTDKPMANISDHISMYNIAPFGKCRSLAFPATAAATAAAHGKLTPMPCVPNTPLPWISGKTDYIIKGSPALLKSNTCTCMWGGTISIVNDGQNPTVIIDMSHIPIEKFETNPK